MFENRLLKIGMLLVFIQASACSDNGNGTEDPVPIIQVSPQSLSFEAAPDGEAPESLSLQITNQKEGALTYTVSCPEAWLSCTPSSGQAPGSVTVSVDPSGLVENTYDGELSVSSAKAENSPLTVAVTLTVKLPDFSLVVFHTNDRHSHFLGLPNGDYDPSTTGDGTLGGAARWAKLVEDARAGADDVLLLDAGDFSMGTMAVAAENNAADLNFMKFIGYNAAVLGNHEFDWGPGRLAEMIQAAESPPIPLLATNIKFSESDSADDTLEALYGDQGEAGKLIHPYIVIQTPSGVKVGMLGLMGVRAAAVSNAGPVKFSDDIDEMAVTTQTVVDTLRNEMKVDLVLCLAHLGIHTDGMTPSYETVELAKRTEGIDLILSGHSHTDMADSISVPSEVEGSSWITYTKENASYGSQLGHYQIQREAGAITITGAGIDIDDTLEALPGVTDYLDGLVEDIESYLQANFPIVPADGAFLDGGYFQALTTSSFDLLEHAHENNNMAYLLADAMREDCGSTLAAVSGGGDVRGSLMRTNGNQINLADAFIASPLGSGPDGLLGYPLVKAHLLLPEIRLALEDSTAFGGLADNDLLISLSGMKIEFDSSRSKYDRITKMVLYENIDESDPGTVIYDEDNGGYQVDEFNTMYSICVSSYIASLFSEVSLHPRDEEGNQVFGEDVYRLIARDADENEIKIWYSLARKLSSFTAGVPDLYNDDEQANPAGPYWRRAWDKNVHP